MIPFTTIRVPASSANLGPGFDAMGLAIDLWLTCRVSPASSLVIRSSGRDVDAIPADSRNLIWQTALGVAAGAGRDLPAAEVEIVNDIPLGKGLGSSAAAIVAGVAIGAHLLDLKWDSRAILDEAARIEGHPDNVAPAVLGGFVVSAVGPDGKARCVRLDIASNIGVAIVVPDFVLPTKEARAVLPVTYPKTDAVFNVQRSALLTAGLIAGDLSVFPVALDDRMHQPYRARLVPGLEEILALRIPGLLGCALSGAGPGVAVFYENGHDRVCEQVQAVFAKHGCESELASSRVSSVGLAIE